MRNKPSTKRARSPTPRPPEAPPGWSNRWRVSRSAATAMKHAIRHRVVSQIVLPEVAAFMADGRVLVRDHRDEVCCVSIVTCTTFRPASAADIISLQEYPYLVRLNFRTNVNAALLRLVAVKLKSLRILDLSFSRGIDAAGLAAVAELPQLESLDLWDCYIGSECLAQVAKLSTLRVLDLSGNFVGATDLAEVSKLSQLQCINLKGCRQVGAAAIAELSKLPHLENIYVGGCKVTAAEVALLFPKCRVVDLPFL